MKFGLGLAAVAVVAMQAEPVKAEESTTIGLKILEGVRGGWLGFNRGLYKRANSMPMSPECMNDEAAHILTTAIHQVKHDGLAEGDWFDGLGNFTLVAANLTNCKFRQPFTEVWNFCSEAHKIQKEQKEKRKSEKEAEKATEETSEATDGGDRVPLQARSHRINEDAAAEYKKDRDNYDFALEFDQRMDEATQACTIGGALDGFSKNAFILMGKVSNASQMIKDWDNENIDALHQEYLQLGEDIGTFLRISLGFDPQ